MTSFVWIIVFQGKDLHNLAFLGCKSIKSIYHFIYGLPVYGASEPDLNIIQNFLDRCHKRRFTSQTVSIKDLLKKQDCKIFKKVTSINNHPLALYIPSKKVCSYNLRKKQCARPKINTERFMSAFVNRLIFKHNLSIG